MMQAEWDARTQTNNIPRIRRSFRFVKNQYPASCRLRARLRGLLEGHH